MGEGLKKLDDPETPDGMTENKLISLSVSPKDKALDQKPFDLILETPVESAGQLSSPEPHTTERQRPQPGAVLHSKDIKEKVKTSHVEPVEDRASKDIEEKVETSHVEPVEAGGVPSGGTGLEPMDSGHSASKVNIQTFAGNRRPGEEEREMRPKDRPTARAGSMNEH